MEKVFNIAEHIKQAATKCRKGFSCLIGDKNCLCPVRTINHNHTVQINASGAKFCRYCFHMEAKTYCLCPVRNELYNRYGI
jgi:hypothetical protein